MVDQPVFRKKKEPGVGFETFYLPLRIEKDDEGELCLLGDARDAIIKGKLEHEGLL